MFDLKGVYGFPVDAYDRVLECRILGREVEVDPPEGLLLVVAEQGVLDQSVHMLVGQPRRLTLVEGIHSLYSSIDLVGVRAVTVGG